MTFATDVLFSCAVLLLMVPAIVLLVEVLFGLPALRNQAIELGERPPLTVLMPAHNEAAVIASTIGTVLPQLATVDRLLVVADNCSDRTAAIASAAGADVIERSDATRRGKGYALDFGVSHLRPNAPRVVIVIDADCQIARDALDRLARCCIRTDRPVQALYLMSPGGNADFKTRLAQFAWVVKNQIRPLGLHRMGLPCQLMGTGMAFPWRYLAESNLATAHITEDIKLGIELARLGAPPVFCPGALVTSTFPDSREGFLTQRTRWEHGHLSIILNEAVPLFFSSLLRLQLRSAVLAIDVSVPPLALLALLTVLMSFASFLLYLLTSASLPLRLSGAAVAMLSLALFMSWARYGRRLMPLRDLTLAIPYALSKLPLYAKFLVARQTDWVRSRRGRDEP